MKKKIFERKFNTHITYDNKFVDDILISRYRWTEPKKFSYFNSNLYNTTYLDNYNGFDIKGSDKNFEWSDYHDQNESSDKKLMLERVKAGSLFYIKNKKELIEAVNKVISKKGLGLRKIYLNLLSVPILYIAETYVNIKPAIKN